jgi:hypothetical protein
MICEKVEKMLSNLPEMFECIKENDHIIISTPFEYPDGDLIQLYVLQRNGHIVLSDLAETIRHLLDYDFDIFSSKKREKLFYEIVRNLNVIYFKGELRTHVHSPDEFNDALVRLSEAAFRVSDLIFTFRVGARVTFKDEVSEFLTELNVEFQENYLTIGKSGKSYKIDFYIESPKKPDLMLTLSTWSKTYAEQLVSRTVRIWFDIQRIDGRYNYITLIDDTSDVWMAEHFDLLEDLSEVFVWSKRDELKEVLIR